MTRADDKSAMVARQKSKRRSRHCGARWASNHCEDTQSGQRLIVLLEPQRRYAFTIGHALSESGRNASSAGVVPINL